MKSMKDKIVVVTGGNSGIGFAAAKALKGEGASVIITGRRQTAVEEAASKLGCVGLLTDQSSLTDIDKLVGMIADQYGHIDTLVINAGISKFARIEDTTEQMFDEVMDVNLKGAYFTLSKFIPILKDGSAVVILSSTSASVPAPSIGAYSASKAAINAVVKIAALELASRNIRVNSVSPGPVATEIMAKSGIDDSAMQEHIISGVPLSRLGEASEVASLIRYLCGPEATFITGTEFRIDGGHSI
jgi:NAD(P)-dependent dehydrogenase (short-subunit alcohol dehydrogenase family)